MGLGPPICDECNIIMSLQEGGLPPWHCPRCKKSNTDTQCLFELNRSQRQTCEDNTKFFHFLKGRDYGNR